MKLRTHVLVCTLPSGEIVEGEPARAMLSEIQDFGWPGTIDEAPVFTYRTVETEVGDVEIIDLS